MRTTKNTNEPLNYWAIRVNSTIVELRIVRGPARVKVSSLTKKVKVVPDDDTGGCNCTECKASRKPVLKTITYKHTSFLNGKALGYYSFYNCTHSDLQLRMGDKDAIKLTPTQIALAKSAAWREANL